jgi:hypothetical protein
MEVLLARAKQQGKQFCTGLPLVPTMDDVASWLAKERRVDAGPGVPPPRQRSKLKDAPSRGESTWFLGKGESMRLRNANTNRAMLAVGFFLYTQCEGNKGDKWPKTLGAFRRLKWQKS